MAQSDPTQPFTDHDYVQPLMSINLDIPLPNSQPNLPSIDDICETYISLISHIPFSCRDQVSDLFSIHLEKACHDPSFRNFHVLFLIPKLILFSPVRRGKNTGRNQKTAILDRIRRFHSGDFLPLWNEAVSNQAKLSRAIRKSQPSATVSSNARRAEKFARLG